MTTIAIFLITLAVLYKPGGSIMCYYCPDKTLSSECTDTRNCTAANTMCKTTVLSPDVSYPFLGNEVVTRSCSPAATCLPSDMGELGNSQFVFCCNLDLCNNRGLNATATDGSAGMEIRAAHGAFLLGLLLPLTVMWP
ncbi:ly6/PLAUR domain-containing protein 2-like [Anomaloglossus baeobatrachus]|uniref:ly6/PLAUR domain-containing protein 2-like n=1 Tax=Anomaloglossus baeobatrachus TaxID=238106 RepID=UPI003F503B5B